MSCLASPAWFNPVLVGQIPCRRGERHFGRTRSVDGLTMVRTLIPKTATVDPHSARELGAVRLARPRAPNLRAHARAAGRARPARAAAPHPAPCTVHAAAPQALASSTLVRRFKPRRRPAIKPASKASPAPVLSTTVMTKAGTWHDSPPTLKSQPAEPRLRTTNSAVDEPVSESSLGSRMSAWVAACLRASGARRMGARPISNDERQRGCSRYLECPQVAASESGASTL